MHRYSPPRLVAHGIRYLSNSDKRGDRREERIYRENFIKIMTRILGSERTSRIAPRYAATTQRILSWWFEHQRAGAGWELRTRIFWRLDVPTFPIRWIARYLSIPLYDQSPSVTNRVHFVLWILTRAESSPGETEKLFNIKSTIKVLPFFVTRWFILSTMAAIQLTMFLNIVAISSWIPQFSNQTIVPWSIITFHLVSKFHRFYASLYSYMLWKARWWHCKWQNRTICTFFWLLFAVPRRVIENLSAYAIRRYYNRKKNPEVWHWMNISRPSALGLVWSSRGKHVWEYMNENETLVTTLCVVPGWIKSTNYIVSLIQTRKMQSFPEDGHSTGEWLETDERLTHLIVSRD